ncbi:CD44 antigen isoform X3 [Colius striatus]|uniref:CD44 antigen isoform X3 n=1 Tax=Colius striatus TaxID=57412 RepID=UPI002B1D3ECC|nr:CD44 antigen isoform X3 [Colius striatus]
MASFTLWATFGLCLLKLCLTETQFNVSCRYGGVFHVEKNGRYSLTRPEAVELCRALNSTLATLEQLRKAHDLGFETCRYGFVVGHIVIPRINPYHLCAANHTGIYKLSANTTGRYDAYCYNATETRDINCEPVERLDTSFLSNQDEIVIDNADGSRYNADGTRHGGESSTSGVDEENVGSGSQHDTTPMDASIRRSSPSYYGSVTPVSQLPDHSSGGGEKEIPRKYSDDEVSPVSPDISLVTATDDYPEKDDGQYPPSTTPGPHQDKLETATTQAQWNAFSNHWLWSNPGEKTQEPTQAPKADVTSSGNGSDDEDSSEEKIYATVSHGWDRSVAKYEYAPSTTVDSQHETLLEISTQDHWNPVYTDEEEQYPSSTGKVLVTNENEKHQGPTRHPLLHNVHAGWISQEQNPANATSSTEQHEVTVAGEKDIEKASTHTAMVFNHGSKQNDSVQDTLMHPGWDKGDDYATQPTIMDRIIPSRENNHEKESSTTAASPDGAHGKDPTQPPLPSDHEPGEGTEGIAHPTDIPGDQVLHRTTASTRKPGGDSPQMSTITEPVGDVNGEKATEEPLAPGTGAGREREQETTTDGSHVNWIPGVFPDIEDRLNHLQTPLPTITASTDIQKAEDTTQEAWAPHGVVTTAASPDGVHGKDPTQPPLPSDREPGEGTEGIAHPTDIPGDQVLHRTTASTRKPGGDSPLMVTEPVGDVNGEKATEEPLAPGTGAGSEREQETTTDGSHVNWIPGVFPDIEDRLNHLQTPLPTRSTSSIYGNRGPHKGHFESTTFPAEATTTKVNSEQRSAPVPEWLIIVAALVALALILAVCIAVNSRRRCGQKKKLVINNGKGAVEDRKTSGLNGDASKSQEMVHLVHKEQSNDRTGTCDEFLTVNETQNHQDLDMKSGV